MNISTNLTDNIKMMKELLPIGKSYDFVTRDLEFAGRKAYFICINGLCDMDVFQSLFANLQNPEFLSDLENPSTDTLIASKMGYSQIEVTASLDNVLYQILSGPSVLFVDRFPKAIIIDARSYPKRGMDEPDMEQMTRGARDGFVETLSSNTNLIRRRVRSADLTFEKVKIGTVSKTDVAIAYLGDCVNHSLLKELKQTLSGLKVTTLTMGAKSLEELLVPKRFWSVLPSMQLTQRPDVACSYITEGHIILLVDNSPMVLILPCTIFQFTQSPEDYLKNPVVGTYFRLIRFLCIPVNLLLMPVFLLLTTCYPAFTQKWNLLSTGSMGNTRIIFYIIAVELFLDLFRYSTSLNTSKYSGSLSIVGGLIIGDIAVTLNWATPEILFYGGITLLAGLTLSSPELADGLRIYRIFLVLATAFFGVWGFWIALSLVIISILLTPTFGGMSYFWPLAPFQGKALYRLLFRSPTYKAQPSTHYERGKVHNPK